MFLDTVDDDIEREFVSCLLTLNLAAKTMQGRKNAVAVALKKAAKQIKKHPDNAYWVKQKQWFFEQLQASRDPKAFLDAAYERASVNIKSQIACTK